MKPLPASSLEPKSKNCLISWTNWVSTAALYFEIPRGWLGLVPKYYRNTHLIPLLEMQDAPGDRILRKKVRIRETPITLAQWFYSIHSYCRGGRIVVVNHRSGENLRKAFYAEVVEHARSRRQSSGSEAMAFHYQDLTLCNSLYITLLCI
jgi:hypothetical protein